MPIDVTSLTNRRADERWNRTAVGDMLERLTWSCPEQEAIVGWHGAYADPSNERLTYRQANQIANQFANALLAHGAQPGDRVLPLCENSVEAFLTKIAVAKAGLVGAPVNPNLAPDVIRYLIGLIEPRVVVVDAELWPRLDKSFRGTGLQPHVTIPIGGDAVPHSVSFFDFLADHPSTDPEVRIHGDDIWELLFTSGTTSMPKGVMLSHTYAYMSAYSYALPFTRGLETGQSLKTCSFLPLIYHAADHSMGLSAMITGGSLVIGRRAVPTDVAAAVAQEGVTALLAGSPQMVKALTQAIQSSKTSYDLSSLTTLMYAYGMIDPETMTVLKELCGERLSVMEIFAQTEIVSPHCFWPDVWKDKYWKTAPTVNYVGVPNPVVAADVFDTNDQSLAGSPGVTGEVVYRSPALAAGYYKNEQATEEAFRGGWFHSGDACIYDEDGLRIMVDRFKDIIKTGGENVSSLRVEAILREHSGITKAAVVGLPDDRWGEAVTAVVVPKSDQPLDEKEIIDFCRARLAGFETPKSVVIVDTLPETIGGKVLKYVIREQLAPANQPEPQNVIQTLRCSG
jgi:acyl-CoA synthetase (AMP-forming)/AMP-acid ligase II